MAENLFEFLVWKWMKRVLIFFFVYTIVHCYKKSKISGISEQNFGNCKNTGFVKNIVLALDIW